jgi:hypothetical protein
VDDNGNFHMQWHRWEEKDEWILMAQVGRKRLTMDLNGTGGRKKMNNGS